MGFRHTVSQLIRRLRRAWKTKTTRVLAGVLAGMLVAIALVPLPDPLFGDPYATTLRSRDGVLLSACIAADGQWRFPPSDSIPQRFETAIRLAEDEYFYRHPGINPVSLTRAMIRNMRAGKVVSGGSTISMQTVRLLYGNRPRTYLQKVMEMLATLKLELLYSKEEILKAYADHCPFGSNIVGLNAASWRYYGRPPDRLSWGETAGLAVLPNHPGAIFPGRNQVAFLAKRNRLLDKLHGKGYLDGDQLFLAKEEPMPGEIMEIPNDAYHLLHRCMEEGHLGHNVISTLDYRLQREASRRVNEYSARMDANEIHNAAAVVVDIATGNVLAYVGNTNNTGEHGQHVDVITSRRSPGSLLKPVLYAAALDEGLILPTQLLPDVPLFYRGFAPKNFDRTYRGAVPADEALSGSLNVPFVHLLIDYGYEKFHQKLRAMGMRSLDEPAGHYGLSIILGGAETTLWEITGLYAGMARAYANYGVRPYRSGYARDDYHPNAYVAGMAAIPAAPLEDDGFLRVASLGYAFRAMQEVHRPEQEAGWQQFVSSLPIAWKTGTSFGFRDGWALGVNNRYVIGVWVGNADGEGRPGLTGVATAAPLMFSLFEIVDGGAPSRDVYGSPVEICAGSGMLATDHCKEKTVMYLPDYMLNGRHCTYHQLVHLDKTKRYQVNSSCYGVSAIATESWFVLPPVEAWYYGRHHPTYRSLPPFMDGCASGDKQKLFALIYPAQHSRVHIPVEQDGHTGRAVFEATHEDSEASIYWHLDDTYLGATRRHHQMAVIAPAGVHLLTLVDDRGNEIRETFDVVP